jgi:hypothetical protein
MMVKDLLFRERVFPASNFLKTRSSPTAGITGRCLTNSMCKIRVPRAEVCLQVWKEHKHNFQVVKHDRS